MRPYINGFGQLRRVKKLYKHLCELLRHGKRKGKRGNYKSNRGCINGRVPIDLRPVIVEQRVRFGDFEADLMIGKQTRQPLLVLVDRASLYTIIEKLSPGFNQTKPLKMS